MLSKVISLRGVLASVVHRKYPHGKLLKPIYSIPYDKPATIGGQVVVTPVRYTSHRCDAHMNELPVPCAPWEPWYSDKQSFYNKVLLGGILWFLFSLGMMIWTDSIFLNWGPPKNPSPPSDMVEECEDD
ncbi:hypothetical protein PYW07_001661 [Mythimna separata]|uniref:Deltamethrin resistance protein prag01 domain-containing protein n=1 Tax=Mythimna separata TaxID=271217 RepID=A0AAD7YSP8_MYTSE|nr:hypothetical protein PYW07_001661 [Mythimna separata]